VEGCNPRLPAYVGRVIVDDYIHVQVSEVHRGRSGAGNPDALDVDAVADTAWAPCPPAVSRAANQSGGHQAAADQALVRDPARFHVHFTRTYGSSPNQVDIWSAASTNGPSVVELSAV
jgi:hypothetical protein